MASVPFHLVDVFSSTAYTGNPLAIVDLTSSGSQDLTSRQMQLITRQFNLSETTFLLPPTQPGATYLLRSFLPVGLEVFGAGHNTLGVWWWLASSGRLAVERGIKSHFAQQIGDNVQDVWVAIDEQGHAHVTNKHLAPQFYRIHPSLSSLAASVNILESDIGAPEFLGITSPFPAQVVSTSSSRHLMVPLKTLEALERVSTNPLALAPQLAIVDDTSHGIYLFVVLSITTGTGKSKVIVRARFFNTGMTSEDPATGSAAGPLGAYLGKYGVAQGSEYEVEVQQGWTGGRRSVITVSVNEEGQGIEISGTGAIIGSGNIFVPGDI